MHAPLRLALGFALLANGLSDQAFCLENGSFESNFDHWTATGNVSIQSAPPYVPTDGGKLVSFNALNTAPNGSLTQTVPTLPGRIHSLRFDVGNLSYNPLYQKLHVSVVDAVTTHVADTIWVPGLGGGNTTWIGGNYGFTVSGNTVTLSLTDVSDVTDGLDLLLDHVRLVPAYFLNVSSTLDDGGGPDIAMTPESVDHLTGGVTAYTRRIYGGETVTLTAPAIHQGRQFHEWLKDGVHLTSDQAAVLTLTADTNMQAIYGPGITVTPNSGSDLHIEGFATCGPFSPLITDYQIHNESATSLNWSAALDVAGSPWLTVWPRGGTLAAGEVRTIKFLVTSDITALPAGSLENHVRFTTPSGTLDAPVSVLIRDPEKVAVNGSFESGLDSWSGTGHVSLQSGPPYTITDGNFLVAFNAVNSTPDGVLKQSLRTETGVRYFLDFDAGVLAYNTNEQRLRLRVRDAANAANPLMVDSVFPILGTGGGANVWTARHYEFTATSDLTEISFSDESNFTESIDLLLDHVRVYNPAYHLSVTAASDENDPALGIGGGDSLRETLAEAARVPGGNRITISSLVQIANLPDPVAVNSAVGIDTAGQDVTFNGWGFPGGLDVSAPACMRHLTLTGNTQSAVRNTSDLMLLDSQVTENTSTTAAAGIHNTAAFSGPSFTEGTLVADRCRIDRNHSTTYAGGLGGFGDALLTRTTLDSNTTDGNGGALANGSGFGVNWFMLDACTVSRNTAGGSGGAFAGATGYKSFGHLEAVNSTFFGNSAVIYGGGFLTNGPVNLLHCTVSQNTCPTGQGGGVVDTNINGWGLSFTNSIVAGNSAATDPDLSGTPPVLRGANLTSGDPMLSGPGNSGGPTETLLPSPASPAVDAAPLVPETPATDQRGAPRASGALPDLGAVELKQLVVNTLADENDGIATGGISLRDAVAANTTQDADVIRFASTLSGGTIHLTHGVIGVLADYSLFVDGTTLSNGITVSGNHESAVFNFLFSNATLRGLTITDSSGSAVEAFVSHLDLDDCVFRNNQTSHDGGALVLDDSFNGSASVTRCVFDQNSASGNGGAIFNRSLLRITDSTFTDNHAGGNGGAIVSGIYRVGLTVENSTFTGNSADKGGAISAGSLRLVHSTLSGNQATTEAGGLLSTSAIPSAELGVSLSNSIIAGNTAPANPDVSGPVGGLFGMNFLSGDPKLAPLANYGGRTMTIPPLPASPVIDAGILLSSTPAADQRGWPRVSGTSTDIGAVELHQIVVNTLIDENDGIHVNGVSLREAFSDHTGTLGPWYLIQPHGEWIRFSPELDGGTIDWTLGGLHLIYSRNQFVDAGDLHTGLTIRSNSGFVGLNSCHNFGFRKLTFTGQASIWIFEGQLVLEDCDFINMTSAQSGAALQIDRYGGVTIDGCNFLNNHSDANGGAIETKGQLVLRNCTFAGNSAAGQGGAIHTSWEENCSTDISNCTFAGNTSGGHGGAIAGYFCTLKHCTLSGNTAGSGLGGGLFNLAINSDDPNVIENSIISGNTGLDLTGESAIIWAHNFLGSVAKLAPLANYGGRTMTMPPLPGSPVIDAGILLTSTPATDQLGAPRPRGPLPDIGAVEAFPFSSIPLLDSDGDGIDDRLEPAYGLVVGNDDSSRDSDGDGSPDAEEIANMTDPQNPASLLRILSFTRLPDGQTFRLTYSAFPGLSYTLESDQNLDFHGPTARTTPLGAATNNTGTVDLIPMSGRDFFRIRRNP
jgi:predicted outer membrane repeat protein